MLDEKLKQARRQSTQSRFVVFFGGALIAALAAGGLYYASQSQPKSKPVAVPESETRTQTETSRSEVLSRLETLNNDLWPRLETLNLDGWAPGVKPDMETLKTQAEESFAQGDFNRSGALARELKDKVLEMVSTHESGFREALSKAQTSYEQGDVTSALRESARALSYRPDHGEALGLDEKIQRMPDLMEALAKADVAQSENNLEKELAALETALEIDPGYGEIAKRAETLRQDIQERAYAGHLKAGLAASERLDVETARQALSSAEAIFPKRNEAETLRQIVQSMESNIRLERALRLAMDAVRKDDWQTARTQFEKAAREAPKRLEVVDGLDLSKTILELRSKLENHARNPLRLGGEANRSAAKADLAAAEPFFKQSQSLERAGGKVLETLDQLAEKREIRVLSDGVTFVQVRGVGRVGQVDEKIIRLTPGNYLFEGKRDGYKSKLVEVVVPLERKPLTVRVVCDEPI